MYPLSYRRRLIRATVDRTTPPSSTCSISTYLVPTMSSESFNLPLQCCIWVYFWIYF